ncbi:MAG: flagellar basal body-associated FliL family protein, partial [bacterium]
KKIAVGGGGISFAQVAIISVVLIILTAIGTMVTKNMIGENMGKLSGQINNVENSKYTSTIINVPDRIPFKECAALVRLQDKALLVNLADGKHYLSAEISICLDPNYKPEGKEKIEDVFTEQRDKVLYACNEYLSTLTMSSLFQTGVSAPAPANTTGELSLEDTSNVTPDFSKRMDQVRGELLKVLQKRGLTFIADVYFTSFLVQ